MTRVIIIKIEPIQNGALVSCGKYKESAQSMSAGLQKVIDLCRNTIRDMDAKKICERKSRLQVLEEEALRRDQEKHKTNTQPEPGE